MSEFIQNWQNIYTNFNPIAFSLFGFNFYWYSLCYITALFGVLFIAQYFIKKDHYCITKDTFDDFFIWLEMGVVLGARLGYVFFYSTQPLFYLTNPWEIFNVFQNGEFVGIRGMSYHGGVIGFLIASWWWCQRKKVDFFAYMDLLAVSIPLAYTFGRVGNFLNQELVGRATDMPWGIYANGILRHPSQLYEAFLEGICVFVVIFCIRKVAFFQRRLIFAYAILYSLARFISEFWRAPDAQLGFLAGGFTMGQIMSFFMITCAIGGFVLIKTSHPLKKA